MERGPPEPKRMRSDYNVHSPTTYGGRAYDPADRALPAPLAPPLPPGEPHRRHSNHYDDTSRAYNGYPRDMKPEPGLEQRPHIDPLRPNSTGRHPIHRRPVEDMRPPYDHHSMSNGSMASPYPPPPPQAYPERPYYNEPTPLSEIAREPIGYPIEISTSSSSTQKKRSARTTQACEACRHAKAKCTDPKPCQGCQEKGIECKYDPPPPKQSDKAQLDVTNQIAELQKFLKEEAARQRREQRTILEQQDRKLDAIQKAMTKFAPGITFDMERYAENYSTMLKEEESDEMSASLQPSIEGDDRDESMDDPSGPDSRSQPPALRPRPRAEQSPDMTYLKEINLPTESSGKRKYYGEEDTEGTLAQSKKEGAHPIPLKHTTGSHYVLVWPSVRKLWETPKGVNPAKVEKFDPYTIEMNRGIIHLHGTGEGFERFYSNDKSYLHDSTSSQSGSDKDNAESVGSPAAEKSWGTMSNRPPTAEPPQVLLDRWNPEMLKPDRTPSFDEPTVRRLTKVYMDTLNIMHPIITKAGMESITRLFLKEIAVGKTSQPQTNLGSGFLGGQGQKRKRFASPSRQTVSVDDDIRLPYTMSTATMLLILALGRICEHKRSIPMLPRASDGPPATSPPNIMMSPSPVQKSPKLPHSRLTYPPPSPIMGSDASSADKSTKADVKNIDVIPGLAYFALATTILGDHEGEHNLPMVQACLLAGLYHGQLGRPLQSYSYIYRAGVTMQWILTPSDLDYYAGRPKLDVMPAPPGVTPEANRIRKRKENHVLFSFWTCLQLESDILAELDCPKRSGILELEPVMPWPHVSIAEEDGDLTDVAQNCYLTQLIYRNHLNALHSDLYNQGAEKLYAPDKIIKMNMDKATKGVVESLILAMDGLEDARSQAPMVAWTDNDPPADNIIEARLRGKFYGARNVTYRHFLRAVLEAPEGANLPPQILEYAKRCVQAMKHSCKSFSACTKPGERLIVTNCWGTAHAQWGNVIVLHAVRCNKLLRDCISEEELVRISATVRNFLHEVAQPGSAIALDISFLDAVMTQTNIIGKVEAYIKTLIPNASFSEGETPN